MKKLVILLKSETQSLKEQYVEKTLEWAKVNFSVLSKRALWKEIDWCIHFGLEPSVVNEGKRHEFKSFPKGFYSTKLYVTYDRLKKEAKSVYVMGLEEYLERQEKAAIQHYENSILKLADRIEKKGLNQDNLQVKTAHVGVNIETTLTDGEKTVRAFTIIAEGQVQRPHYRYLVK